MCLEAIAVEDIIACTQLLLPFLPLFEEKMKVKKQIENGYYRLLQITHDQFCLANDFWCTMNRSRHNAFVSQQGCS